jgi:hypothetical protein
LGAVGELEEENLGEAADEFEGFDGFREFDPVVPALGEAGGSDEGGAILGQAAIDDDIDAALPEVGLEEFFEEGLSDAFCGDGESGGFEGDEGVIGVGLGGGWLAAGGGLIAGDDELT